MVNSYIVRNGIMALIFPIAVPRWRQKCSRRPVHRRKLECGATVCPNTIHHDVALTRGIFKPAGPHPPVESPSTGHMLGAQKFKLVLIQIGDD